MAGHARLRLRSSGRDPNPQPPTPNPPLARAPPGLAHPDRPRPPGERVRPRRPALPGQPDRPGSRRRLPPLGSPLPGPRRVPPPRQPAARRLGRRGRARARGREPQGAAAGLARGPGGPADRPRAEPRRGPPLPPRRPVDVDRAVQPGLVREGPPSLPRRLPRARRPLARPDDAALGRRLRLRDPRDPASRPRRACSSTRASSRSSGSACPAVDPLGERATRDWLFQDPLRTVGVREYVRGDSQRASTGVRPRGPARSRSRCTSRRPRRG